MLEAGATGAATPAGRWPKARSLRERPVGSPWVHLLRHYRAICRRASNTKPAGRVRRHTAGGRCREFEPACCRRDPSRKNEKLGLGCGGRWHRAVGWEARCRIGHAGGGFRAGRSRRRCGGRGRRWRACRSRRGRCRGLDFLATGAKREYGRQGQRHGNHGFQGSWMHVNFLCVLEAYREP